MRQNRKGKQLKADKIALFSEDDFVTLDLVKPTRKLQQQLLGLTSQIKGKPYSILKERKQTNLVNCYVLPTDTLANHVRVILRGNRFPSGDQEWEEYLMNLRATLRNQYTTAKVVSLLRKQPLKSTVIDPREWIVAVDGEDPIALIQGSRKFEFIPPRRGRGGEFHLTTARGSHVLFRPKKSSAGNREIASPASFGDESTPKPAGFGFYEPRDSGADPVPNIFPPHPFPPPPKGHIPADQPRSADRRAEQPLNREIFVTGHTLAGESAKAFETGAKYKLRFGVGIFLGDNLAVGNKEISDVPQGGMATHWNVSSVDVEFISTPSTSQIQKVGDTWIAEFDLLIPERGNSRNCLPSRR